MDPPDRPFRFLDLPPELRLMIYEICFKVPTGIQIPAKNSADELGIINTALLRTSQQLLSEAVPILYGQNTFIIAHNFFLKNRLRTWFRTLGTMFSHIRTLVLRASAVPCAAHLPQRLLFLSDREFPETDFGPGPRRLRSLTLQGFELEKMTSLSVNGFIAVLLRSRWVMFCGDVKADLKMCGACEGGRPEECSLSRPDGWKCEAVRADYQRFFAAFTYRLKVLSLPY